MAAGALAADLHAHTLASGHAFSTLAELASAASTAGLAVLGVTDHGPSMQGAPTAGYFEMFDRVPSVLHSVRVLLGCEANIIDADGQIDLPEFLWQRQRVILAGLHDRTPYPNGSSARDNTRAVIRAMQRAAVHIIAHPYRPMFPVEIDDVVEAACDYHILLEVNLSVLKPRLHTSLLPERDELAVATRRMLDRLRCRGGAFVVNTDAHHSAEVGPSPELLEAAERLLEFDVKMAANSNAEQLASFIPAVACV